MKQLIFFTALALIAAAAFFFIRDQQVRNDAEDAMPRAWWHDS